MYKLVARNEKGEATSQVVEVTEIMEEGEKPKIKSGLKSAVSFTIEIFPFSTAMEKIRRLCRFSSEIAHSFR